MTELLKGSLVNIDLIISLHWAIKTFTRIISFYDLLWSCSFLYYSLIIKLSVREMVKYTRLKWVDAQAWDYYYYQVQIGIFCLQKDKNGHYLSDRQTGQPARDHHDLFSLFGLDSLGIRSECLEGLSYTLCHTPGLSYTWPESCSCRGSPNEPQASAQLTLDKPAQGALEFLRTVFCMRHSVKDGCSLKGWEARRLGIISVRIDAALPSNCFAVVSAGAEADGSSFQAQHLRGIRIGQLWRPVHQRAHSAHSGRWVSPHPSRSLFRFMSEL